MRQANFTLASKHIELKYNDNFKFSCQRCGECCKRPGYFTPDSMEVVADHLGMDKDDLYMKPVSSLYPEQEWQKIRSQNVRQKGLQSHMETRIITRKQDIIDVDLSLSVLKGPDGKVTGSIGIMSDITELKKMQTEQE